MWGAIGTGIFAVAAVGGTAGLIDGNPEQLVIQLIATVFTVAFAAIGTFIIIKAIDLAIGLRVRAEDEEAGLDVSVHGETAYVPWAGTADGSSAATAAPQAPAPAPAATEAEPA
jgi:Amt family ammonium transporter